MNKKGRNELEKEIVNNIFLRIDKFRCDAKFGFLVNISVIVFTL